MVEGTESKVVSLCLMRVCFGVYLGSPSVGMKSALRDFGGPRFILFTKLVAERGSPALTSEKRVLKAFPGSVQWI